MLKGQIAMKYNQVEVGNRIRNVRNALGMSQEVFAEALGIGRVHLAKIEVGMRNPSIDLLIDISELTSLTLDYLVLGRK